MTEKAPAKSKAPVDKSGPGEDVVNTALPNAGDHDRVSMLSVRVDGTHDQHAPELIGDVEATRAATREQFKQQAVSAADVVSIDTGVVVDAPQDPAIAEKQAEHEKVAEAAGQAADAAVDKLTK